MPEVETSADLQGLVRKALDMGVGRMINGRITPARLSVTLLSCSILLIPPGGLTYAFTSMSPYLFSFLVSVNPDTTLTTSAMCWLYIALMIGQGISMIVGGYLERFFTTRQITATAVVVFNVNVCLIYWTCHYFASLLLSYLFIGLTLGLLYIMSLVVGLSWVLPEYHGLCSGLLCLGYGLSTSVVSPLQTLFINPNNVEPVTRSDSDMIFTSPDLLENIPHLFLVFAMLSFIIQFPLSFLIVKNPEVKPNQIKDSLTLSEMFCKPEFTILFLAFGLNKVPLAYIGSNAKFYGERFIVDDMYLSVVIGLSGVFNALGRPFWGFVNDKVGLKWSLFSVGIATASCILLSYLSAFWHDTSIQKVAFCGGVWGAFFCCTGNYAIFPAATIYYFGQENFGSKYGFLYLSQGMGAILSGIYTSLIPLWMPNVMTVVVTSLVSACICLVLKTREEVNSEEFEVLVNNGGGKVTEEMEMEEIRSLTMPD